MIETETFISLHLPCGRCQLLFAYYLVAELLLVHFFNGQVAAGMRAFVVNSALFPVPHPHPLHQPSSFSLDDLTNNGHDLH